MPSQKSETAVSQAVQFPLLPQLEWSKKAIEMYATACAGALGFTAKRLQAQADVSCRAWQAATTCRSC